MALTRRRRDTHRDPQGIASGVSPVPARPSKGRRSPEEARQEIIDAARVYLTRYGFRDFTVDKVMLGTKIGRSAFYVYFSNIYDLAAVFIHELSHQIEAVSTDWFDDEGEPIERIRSALRKGVEFWETNGRMIRALEEASSQHNELRAIWRDAVAMRPVHRVTEAILRDQAKGLIAPMDAQELSIALNRFNVTYLNDRLGHPRRKSQHADKEKIVQTLERVWIGTLYGKVTNLKKAGRERGLLRR